MPGPMEPGTAASDTGAAWGALIGRDGAGRTAGASHPAIAECVPPVRAAVRVRGATAPGWLALPA
jgi:hypothetical protein